MKKFALIGASGYIAHRHLKAIKETGNDLIVALDPYDGVGIMDNFFPNADFFTEPERFDRHLDKLRRRKNEEKIDYVSICSPNYLHDAHIRMSLRNNCDIICEKPVVINPWNVKALKEIENETGNKINTILQLRHHPIILELYKKIKNENNSKIYDINLTYITSRGKWYYNSWKGDIEKSGGIVTNIGIHFFDMLIWIFGDVEEYIVYQLDKDKASGVLILENAKIKWFLSLNYFDIPEKIRKEKRTYRSLIIDGEEIEFSDGFTDLHTVSYREILKGNGFGLDDAFPSINLVHKIKTSKIFMEDKKKHEI